MVKNNENEKKIVSARTAAKIMHMAYPIFMKKLNEGELDLKFARRGHLYLFYKKDVEELLENSFQKVDSHKK
jgi:hypothetical protein